MKLLNSLRLENFCNYKSARIDFSAGLNLIKGRNSGGKTTLLNAIVFALFGEVPGIEKSSLISRTHEGNLETEVSFTSPITGQVVEVLREAESRKGGFVTVRRGLRIAGNPEYIETDEALRGKVTDLLGISYKKFVNLVYVMQGELTSVLNPSRDTMDLILGINLLREMKEEFTVVKKRLSDINGLDIDVREQLLSSQAFSAERELAALSNELEENKKIVSKLEGRIAMRASEGIDELKRHVDGINELRVKLALLEKAHGVQITAHGELRSFPAKLAEIKERIEKETAERDQVAKIIERQRAEIGRVSGRISSLEDEIATHEKLLESGKPTCPTCGSKISSEALKSEDAKLRARKAKYETDLAALELELGGRVEKLDALDEALDLSRERLRELERAYDEMRDAAREVKETKERLLSLRRRAADLLTLLGVSPPASEAEFDRALADALKAPSTEEVSLYNHAKGRAAALESSVRATSDMLAKLNAELSSLKEQRVLADRAKKIADGLEAAIGKTREALIEEISRRALMYCYRMTNQQYYKEVKIDKENYQVSVVLPSGGALPASRVGGGHQALLSIAIRLALLDVLRFNSLLILDEPTVWIDKTNLPYLAEYLVETSRRVGQMLMVTHTDICEPDAASIIEVSNTGSKSSVST